jgi:hypothetical protein
MNPDRHPDESTNSFPAPDFAQRLQRYPGPDDSPWWRLWMSGYAVPAVYTAWRSGLFSVCKDGYHTVEDIAEDCGISRRAARVLSNHLASLGLLMVRDGCFQATERSVARFGDDGAGGEWSEWLNAQYENPVTPARLYKHVRNTGDVIFPLAPRCSGPEDSRLVELPWAFPAAVVADKLGLPELLGKGPGQAISMDNINKGLADTEKTEGSVDPVRLQQLLDRLRDAGIVNEGPERQYTLASEYKEFLIPTSCYYKGGTLRLMEMAPPCAFQSWEALTKEQAPAESRMDETIKSPDLNETYAFALHMDAQGAGADAVLAHSGLINPADRVLDIAGGAGSYSIAPAIHLPEARFFLLEQSPMTEIAQLWIEQHGVEQRVRVLEGNMFELSKIEDVVSYARPSTVFASNIFHDWDADDNLSLAREVHAILPAGGRFILHEMPLAEDGYSNDIAAGFSETLRIWTEGMQYKLSELEQLLKQAGFGRIETADGLGPYKFVTGIK